MGWSQHTSHSENQQHECEEPRPQTSDWSRWTSRPIRCLRSGSDPFRMLVLTADSPQGSGSSSYSWHWASTSWQAARGEIQLGGLRHVHSSSRHPKQRNNAVVTLCLLITTIFVFNPLYLPIRSLLLGVKWLLNSKIWNVLPQINQIWVIFNHLRLWIAVARHNLKWLKMLI